MPTLHQFSAQLPAFIVRDSTSSSVVIISIVKANVAAGRYNLQFLDTVQHVLTAGFVTPAKTDWYLSEGLSALPSHEIRLRPNILSGQSARWEWIATSFAQPFANAADTCGLDELRALVDDIGTTRLTPSSDSMRALAQIAFTKIDASVDVKAWAEKLADDLVDIDE